LFGSIEQVQDMAARWLWTYNHERPNMAPGGITPTQNWHSPLGSAFDVS
jgi:putative transposase